MAYASVMIGASHCNRNLDAEGVVLEAINLETPALLARTLALIVWMAIIAYNAFRTSRSTPTLAFASLFKVVASIRN